MGSQRVHVVEVDNDGLVWGKASFSDAGSSNCVEIAIVSRGVLVRSTRDRNGPRLSVSEKAWSGLVSWIAMRR